MRDRYAKFDRLLTGALLLNKMQISYQEFNNGMQLRFTTAKGTFDWYPTTGTLKKLGDSDYFEFATNERELYKLIE